MNRFSDGKKSIVNHYKEEREPKAPFLSIILLSLIYLFVNKSWIYENLLFPNKFIIVKNSKFISVKIKKKALQHGEYYLEGKHSLK